MELNLLFLGASNTDCGHCFSEDWLGDGYVKFVDQAIKEQECPGERCKAGRMVSGKPSAAADWMASGGQYADTVHTVNGGTDGFTFPRILQKWKTNWEGVAFDNVFVLGGINEVGALMDSGKSQGEYEALLSGSAKALDCLLDRLKRSGCRKVCVIEPFLFSRPAYLLGWKPCLEEVRQMIQSVLTKHPDVSYLPTQEALDEGVRLHGTDAVTTDGIHLAPQGHRILAGLVLARICRTF